MSKSLQDQLLGAGLIDAKKAKKITKDSHKAKKVKRRSKDDSLTESQMAVVEANKAKHARDLALNNQLKAEEQKKSIAAQIIQLIKHYRLTNTKGDVGYNFTDNSKVKKIYLNNELFDHVSRGRICIARLGESYELNPKPIADKIEERDASVLIRVTDTSETTSHKDEDEDYYAQFEIPDDLMW